jgi:hypothetical protein
MPDDPYFNAISLQLMHTPASSRAEMAAVAGGSPPAEPPPGALFPLDSARGWTKELLQYSFHPPDAARFLAFPMEAGLCDVVRAEYSAGGYRISVAETRNLISFVITGAQFPAGATEMQKAEQIARKLFVQSDSIHFERSGAFDGTDYGRQQISRGTRVDEEWPHWLDMLHWWSAGSEIGFITLKALGGPTRGLIGPDEIVNVKWF